MLATGIDGIGSRDGMLQLSMSEATKLIWDSGFKIIISLSTLGMVRVAKHLGNGIDIATEPLDCLSRHHSGLLRLLRKYSCSRHKYKQYRPECLYSLP